MSTQTQMRSEILEIPAAIDALLSNGAGDMQKAADALRETNPAFFISVARGSSDHAATYFKYASELIAGVPVASVGPSIASIYDRRLKLSLAASLAISQSGKSPDIVRMAEMARAAGALSLALTNHRDSDLAQVSQHTLELHAGVEQSVAATKTFVTSVVSAVWLLAEWQQDADLLKALRALPAVLETATQQNWGALVEDLTDAQSLFCLGRGPAFALSNEAALKFKETCRLHAESYSSAEVLHGPVSIVGRGFPVLILSARDAAEASVAEVADRIAGKGANVFVTSDHAVTANRLPAVRTDHPLTDPIALIVSFYAMVEQVARARGINPDAPRHLKKVTETV
ncbi:SIS domain-containing protein [uncultured Roseobacter sp.]|uniref:SIS domain-containing protein n=1 Tax=uncultured Roseobacter sp. TaxID=114847 RepID=UPI002616A857|nr:SIS domain-containing protein [uncultured Roseobacter sp.]